MGLMMICCGMAVERIGMLAVSVRKMKALTANGDISFISFHFFYFVYFIYFTFCGSVQDYNIHVDVEIVKLLKNNIKCT
jgi:hypothetical protein